MTGPFQNQYTAQYNHVALKAVGTKLSGMWGANKLVGTLTGAKVDISLTDASGKPMGTLTGEMSGDGFSGTGSVVPARRLGGGGGGMGMVQPPTCLLYTSRCV